MSFNEKLSEASSGMSGFENSGAWQALSGFRRQLGRREAPMTEFTVNTTRLDPYKNFKFRVKWDGKYVAGISKVSGLKRSSEVVEHREGGDPSTVHKSPGRTKYEAITLERGLTQDSEFHDWSGLIWNF